MWCFLLLEETYENIGTPGSPRGVPHGPVGGGDSDKAEDKARGFGDELLGEMTKTRRGQETKARNEEDEGREWRRNSERGMEMKLQDEDEAGGFGDECRRRRGL